MFKILIRFGCFLPQKKQNNAARAAKKSAFKVKDWWIQIDVDLASRHANHALLKFLDKQAKAGITRSGFSHNFLASIVWNVVQVHDSLLQAPVVNYIE